MTISASLLGYRDFSRQLVEVEDLIVMELVEEPQVQPVEQKVLPSDQLRGKVWKDERDKMDASPLQKPVRPSAKTAQGKGKGKDQRKRAVPPTKSTSVETLNIPALDL